MVRDLVNVTFQEILESSKQSTKNDNIKIAYLQDNDSEKHEWNESDIQQWIAEGIDD